MTEKEWMACTDPQPMLEFLRGKTGDRKLRLFACACCRHIWHLFQHETSQTAVVKAEQTADDAIDVKQMDRAARAVWTAIEAAPDPHLADADSAAGAAARFDDAHPAYAAAKCASLNAAQAVESDENWELEMLEERACQAALLRDIIGNPFRPATINTSRLAWNNGTVTKIAQAIYDDRQLPSGYLDMARLAILADALEEAGCDKKDILDHLRGPGPHVRGCWVVDLVLQRE